MGIIRLGGVKVKKKWATLTESLARQKEIKFLPLRILSSPTTTIYLASALALLKGVPPTKVLKYGLGAGVVKGIATTSPKIVEFIKRKAHPVKAGEYIGTQLESFGKEKADDKLTIKERVKEGLKTAGLIGGGIALAGAGVLGVKKLLEKKREVGLVKKDIKVPEPQLKQPYAPLPSAVPYQISPIGGQQQQIRQPPIQNIIQIQVQ